MFDIPHPDQSFAEMHAYAAPVDHFFFAGEHTRDDGTSGYIEGAIRSGFKAAELVKSSMKK
jgi:monoamine oxidase